MSLLPYSTHIRCLPAPGGYSRRPSPHRCFPTGPPMRVNNDLFSPNDRYDETPSITRSKGLSFEREIASSHEMSATEHATSFSRGKGERYCLRILITSGRSTSYHSNAASSLVPFKIRRLRVHKPQPKPTPTEPGFFRKKPAVNLSISFALSATCLTKQRSF